MSTQAGSIGKLLAAEKKANELIQEAKKAKDLKLKQARTEAINEVKQFRDKKEKEFQEFKDKVMGTSDMAKLDDQTNREIEELRRATGVKRAEVMSYLIGFVTDVHTDYEERK